MKGFIEQYPGVIAREWTAGSIGAVHAWRQAHHQDARARRAERRYGPCMVARIFAPDLIEMSRQRFDELVSDALDQVPAQRRERTLDALTAQIETLARHSPVLMIFEDAHWTDPTSLEVISRTVHLIQELRVLLMVTFRPEFQPPWIGRHHGTALSLNRLAQHDVDGMIDRVVGNRSIPVSIRRDNTQRWSTGPGPASIASRIHSTCSRSAMCMNSNPIVPQ